MNVGVIHSKSMRGKEIFDDIERSDRRDRVRYIKIESARERERHICLLVEIPYNYYLFVVVLSGVS